MRSVAATAVGRRRRTNHDLLLDSDKSRTHVDATCLGDEGKLIAEKQDFKKRALLKDQNMTTRKKTIIGILSFLTIAGGTVLYLMFGLLDGMAMEVTDFPLSDSEMKIMTTEDGVEFVRTPDSFFENLPDWTYEAKYVGIDGLRQAYYDEGPRDGEVILLLHGQPSWSYLYRFMIPRLTDAGFRVIAMDHLGMGRSDKPIDLDFYSYVDHVERLEVFIQELELEEITTFVHDWGSLIGLNVVGNHPQWFGRVVLGNGNLPRFPEGYEAPALPDDPDVLKTVSESFYSAMSRVPAKQPRFRNKDGEYTLLFKMFSGGGKKFFAWMTYARYDDRFRASQALEAGTYFALTQEERSAYDAPFPARISMAGSRVFPSLIMDMKGTTDSAWEGLRSFNRPFLTIIGNNDLGPLGDVETVNYFIENIPGAKGQPHTRLIEADHFLQDDQGEEIARLMIEFIAASSS
jgi:haloalkane dehalogenase